MKKTRASTSRSRTGCITCKIRHVKCDESIPECLKCTSTGRKCDGYLNVATNAELSLKLTPSYSIPFKVPGSQEDRQLIHYFCVQAASDLSGYINSDFWTHSFLRISHSEPVVQKALVAFSSAKLAMENDNKQEAVSNAEVQKKYIRALGGLRKYIAATSKPSVMAVLQCCILFYCFENTRGDHVAALQHLENGLAILRNQRIETKERALLSSNYEDLQEISQVFSRMDLQATLFDDARIPTIEYLPEAVITPSDKLEAWTTLSQACASLDSLTNQVANLLTRNVQYNRSSMEDLPSSLLAKKQNLVAKFQAWQIAYELLNKRSSAERSKKELKEKISALCHLKINHQISYLLLQANYPNDPTIFGASPNPAIEEILNLAEALTISHKGRNRVFSAETGIIAPLFLVAMKAGDRALSDRAVQLLMRLNRREGLHDSKIAADMVLEMWKVRSMEVGKSVANDDNSLSCGLPLEVVAADIVELSGGIAAMAKALGVVAHP